MDYTTNTAHGKSSIFDFLEFHRIINSKVKRVESHFSWYRVSTIKHVDIRDTSSVRDEFYKATEQQDLPQPCGRHLVQGFCSQRILELGTWQMNKFLYEDA